ncbi:hypothetical protein DRP77_08035 [Candidatus Poribacteria bacterium]|nr:MAG: hypothetical protein DRP77_08035 [Candidatus Poribacteria bacterium]
MGLLLLALLLLAGGERDYDDDTDVDFVWSPASGPVYAYKVFLSVDGGGYRLAGTTRTTSYRVRGEDCRIYRIKVQAVDARGNAGPVSDESDPVIVVLPVRIDLRKGFNLIGLPLRPKKPLTSHSLLRKEGIELVSIWDAVRGRWISAFREGDDIIGPDFLIEPGDGFFVKAADAMTITFKGAPVEPEIELHKGFNLISPPKPFPEHTSHSFLRSSGADQISWWDRDRGRWISALRSGGDILGPDFPLRIGRGYFIKSSAEMSWSPSKRLAPPIVQRLPVGKIEPPAPPHPAHGLALLPNGRPAPGAEVELRLLRGGEPIFSSVLKTDRNGRWSADLPRGWAEGDLIEVRATALDLEGRYPPIPAGGDGPQRLGTLVLSTPLPVETELPPSYPNPFNSEVWMPFKLAERARVEILIYDLLGRLVRRIDLGMLRPGDYSSRGLAARWDGRNGRGEEAASGVYIYRLIAGDKEFTGKLILLK